MINHQKRALVAANGHFNAGQRGDALRPASGGVDHHLAGKLIFLTAQRAAIANSTHAPVGCVDRSNLAVSVEAPAARNGSLQICEHQAEDICVRVRACECAKNVRCQVRFKFTRFIRAHSTAANAGGLGGAPPLIEECRVILSALNKEAADIIHAMRRNGLDDAALSNTLARSIRILDSITAAGMQQPVATPGGAVGDVTLLQQRGGDAAQAQVPQDARPRSSSTDNDDLRRFHGLSSKTQTHRIVKPRCCAEISLSRRLVCLGARWMDLRKKTGVWSAMKH